MKTGRHWTIASVAALGRYSLLLLLMVMGCGGSSGNDSGGGSGGSGGGGGGGAAVSLSHGSVLGAFNPVVCATVTAYKAGTTGYGQSATVLATATSGPGGVFSFTSGTCNTGDLIYYVATGGNTENQTNCASAPVNSAIALVSEVGTCPDLPGKVVMNEVTTVASVFALAQFMGTSNPYPVGAQYDYHGRAANNGIAIAFSTAANLIDVTLGKALAATPGGGVAPQANVNSLASALAGCINTSAATSSQCTELFACAKPGATFSTTCTGGSGTTPTDTVGAALSIALKPGQVSTAGLFAGMPPQAPFSPLLDDVPHDWTMPINFAQTAAHLSSPEGLAIDSAGNVWIANLNSSATKLKPDGTVAGTINNVDHPTANFSGPAALAIDNLNNVWIGNQNGASVTALNPDLTVKGNFNPSNTINAPKGVAIQNTGMVWIANSGNNSLSFLKQDGTLAASFDNNNLANANFSAPVAVAVDTTDRVWTVNNQGNSVTRLTSEGTAAHFDNSNTPGAAFNSPTALALDAVGNAWIVNQTSADGTGSITALLPAGGLKGNFNNTNTSGARLAAPSAVAIDSANNVWIADAVDNSSGRITELTSQGAALGSFEPPGARLKHPNYLAIDSAGNLWISNTAGDSVTELVGVAAPVNAPPLAHGPVSPFEPCSPKTCGQLGAQCGTVDDGCGGTIASCGSCIVPQTCGGAGVPNHCGIPQSCSGGQQLCGASCVNLMTDPNHCGSCTTQCAPSPGADPVCTGALCGFMCTRGFADCDTLAGNGCEINLNTDNNHCGSCTTVCPTGKTCSQGVCATICSSDAECPTGARCDPGTHVCGR